MSPLEAGYDEELGNEDADTAANISAHRQVFERLAFFAEDDNSGFLAFHRLSVSRDDPPVIELDSEGQYSWLGINLAEAIFRKAEDMEKGNTAIEWLTQHGLHFQDFGEVGSSTQFLPSMQKLHKRLYWQNRGEPRTYLPTSSTPASAKNPATWLLRPGAEVQEAIIALARDENEAKALLKMQWVECDKDGRVCTVWLNHIPATSSIKVHGIGFGTTLLEVEKILGLPTRQAKPGTSQLNWVRYDSFPSEGLAAHFALNNDLEVKKISLTDMTLS